MTKSVMSIDRSHVRRYSVVCKGFAVAVALDGARVKWILWVIRLDLGAQPIILAEKAPNFWASIEAILSAPHQGSIGTAQAGFAWALGRERCSVS